MSDFKQTMLEFAQAGFWVFPKLRRFKKGENVAGMPPGWNHNKDDKTWASTTDIDTVLEWTNLPDIIGYGINRRKDCFIIDVDCGSGKKNASDALNSLNMLKQEFELPKASMVVRTKSGGYHFYFAHPEIDINMVIGVLPGIDLPLHVVGPSKAGSWVQGEYIIIRGRPSNTLQPLSKKLISWLSKNHVKKFVDTTFSLVGPEDDIANLHNGEIPAVVKDGERHMIALRLIAVWVRSGIPRSNILALLQALNERCEGGGLPGGLTPYVERLDDTLAKPSFNKKNPEPLEFFLKNAMYVKQQDGIFEIPSRNLYTVGLVNVYAHLHWYIDPPEGSTAQPKKVYAYKSFLEHKDRKVVESVGYKPVRDIMYYDPTQRCEVANMYVPPSHAKVEDERGVWDKFENFVSYLGRSKHIKLMEWAAWQVQNPDKKLQVAIALISETRGVGKNLFINIIERCIGMHNCVELSLSKLLEKHNDYPMHSHLAVVNETYDDMADGMNSKERNKAINEVKDLITNSSVSVNPKFLRITSVTSYVNYVFTSNTLSAIPMEDSDRRFEVFIGPETKMTVSEYAEMWNFSDSDIAVIYDNLSKLDIKTITNEYSAVIIDDDKRMAINAGKDFINAAISDAIRDRQYVFMEDIVIFEQFAWYVLNHVAKITQAHMHALFRTYCRPVYRKTSNQGRGAKMTVPSLEFKGDDFRPGCTKIRNLHSCRKHTYYNSKDVRQNTTTSELQRLCDSNNYFINNVDKGPEDYTAFAASQVESMMH